MIKAQFKSYGSYVTDSVYQWDLNQKLSISGLVMSSAPVIAYSSKAVKKAIIVQSKIVDGVINCDIPNALLQFDNDITAHLCSLENKQYKAVEKMIIPVIKRAMPADYLFTDNVPILTYEAIEADIQHYYNLSKSYTDSAKSEIDIERKRIDNIVKDTTDNVVEYKADNFLMSCKSDAQASTTETALNVFKNISSKSENLGNFITISSALKIQIKKSGLYSFDCKVQVTGVNASTGRQYARLKINDVQKNEYMISLVGETDEEFTNFIVSLNEGDTISFTGESDFDDTWITLYTTIHILDYDGKVKIPDITKEVSDIRVGEDGTVYGTAGEAVRKQIGNLTEEKINKPSTTDNNKIPRAKDGEIEWVEVGQPTDEQANSAVSNWLNEHPEVTTTVQDESITEVKLTKELKLLLVNGYINAKFTGLSEKNDGKRNKIAIEKAIEYAILNKVSVFIPSGVYTVDGGISLKSLYALRIFGNGLANSENNSTIIKNDTYTSLFVIDGCNSCSICNLRIRSANAPAIELCNSRSHKNTFKNIDIDNVQTNGIKIASPTGYTYFENVVISLNNKSAVAIDIDGTGVSENDVRPNYIYFKKCAIDSINTGDIPSCNGINLKNCYYIFFDSCDFAHLQNAVCLLENSSYINFNASVFFQCENAFNRMKKNVTYDYGIISNCIFKCLNYAFFIQSDSEYDQLYRYWTVSCAYVNTGIGMFNNSYNDIFEISGCMFEPKNPNLHGKTNRRNCLSLNRHYVEFESLETKDFSISIENECVKSFGALSINSKIVVNSVSVSGNNAIVSLTNTVNSKQTTYVTLI